MSNELEPTSADPPVLPKFDNEAFTNDVEELLKKHDVILTAFVVLPTPKAQDAQRSTTAFATAFHRITNMPTEKFEELSNLLLKTYLDWHSQTMK